MITFAKVKDNFLRNNKKSKKKRVIFASIHKIRRNDDIWGEIVYADTNFIHSQTIFDFEISKIR